MTRSDFGDVGTSAFVEAWRRYPDGIDVETGEPVDDYGYPATAREAFISGAEWAVRDVLVVAAATAHEIRRAVTAHIDTTPKEAS